MTGADHAAGTEGTAATTGRATGNGEAGAEAEAGLATAVSTTEVEVVTEAGTGAEAHNALGRMMRKRKPHGRPSFRHGRLKNRVQPRATRLSQVLPPRHCRHPPTCKRQYD